VDVPDEKEVSELQNSEAYYDLVHKVNFVNPEFLRHELAEAKKEEEEEKYLFSSSSSSSENKEGVRVLLTEENYF
jgi:hypothetical protein